MFKKGKDTSFRPYTTVRIQYEFVGTQMHATNVLIIPFSFYGSAGCEGHDREEATVMPARRCVELTSFAHDEEAPFRTLHVVCQ